MFESVLTKIQVSNRNNDNCMCKYIVYIFSHMLHEVKLNTIFSITAILNRLKDGAACLFLRNSHSAICRGY